MALLLETIFRSALRKVALHRVALRRVALRRAGIPCTIGTLVLAFSAAMGATGRSALAEQPAADLAQSVPAWIAELDSPAAELRRQAEQKLLDAGPAAAEYVPLVLDHLSLETRERMERIESQWRELRAEAEVGGSLVEIQEARTLGAALAAIHAASGVKFDLAAVGPDAERRAVDPPAAALGFWPALDRVLDQTDLDINFYAGGRNQLALVPRQAKRRSRVDTATYAGIYRLEPTIVTARRVLGDPSQNALNLTLSLAWQPNRTPIGLSIPIAELSGRFDNGVELKPQTTGDQIDIATSGEVAETQFYLPMKLPLRHAAAAAGSDPDVPAKADATGIKLLSAQIRALLPRQIREFELLLADVAPVQNLDAMTVSIESIRKSETLHEIRVGIELSDAGRALESHRQWIFENEVHVQLADGTQQNHLGYQVYRQTASGVGIGYLFDLGEDIPVGAKLIYQSPTSVRRSQVPFSLSDIPLP